MENIHEIVGGAQHSLEPALVGVGIGRPLGWTVWTFRMGIGRLGRMIGVGLIGTAGEAQLGCQRSLRRAAAADQVILRMGMSRVLGGGAELGVQRNPQRRRGRCIVVTRGVAAALAGVGAALGGVVGAAGIHR